MYGVLSLPCAVGSSEQSDLPAGDLSPAQHVILGASGYQRLMNVSVSWSACAPDGPRSRRSTLYLPRLVDDSGVCNDPGEPVPSTNECLLLITASRALLRLTPPYRLRGEPFRIHTYIPTYLLYPLGRCLANVLCAHGGFTSRLVFPFSSLLADLHDRFPAYIHPSIPTYSGPLPVYSVNTSSLHIDDNAVGLHGVTTCPYP